MKPSLPPKTPLPPPLPAEDGSFSFAGVPYGNWVLKELESPEGFILSDEVIPVTVEEDGQVVEISLANERVYW